MNFLIMLAIAAGLYFLSDKVLDRIEQARGQRFDDRSVVFFGIFLGSIVTVFLLLNKALGMDLQGTLRP
ncbi:MAG: hypothetical protein O3B76_01705 [Proteobacteria bacterium]|nr:hypothetical protein [Pseudomonadota bacterium]MDA1022747.1 hypothetical protein [Pseudomonadota bacterium]